MQSDKNKIQLRKDDVYNLLKEFANQYRKYGKGLHSEITIVGGSSILLNYGFRETIVDIIKRWCSLSSDALESEYNNRVSTEFKIKEITDDYLEEDIPGKDVAKNIARAVALRLSENDN